MRFAIGTAPHPDGWGYLQYRSRHRATAPAVRLGYIAATITTACLIASAQSTRDVRFYSENIQCHAKLYLPQNFSADSKAAAVILAPIPGQTAQTLDATAKAIATQGILAMAIDYRGWGRSGGYIYLAEDVKFDDRLRFSQHTAKVRIRRKRLIPDDQVDDIRNAISYIQGEPGVDRTRIGLYGREMAAAHILVVSGIDPRVKAIVAISPKIDEKETPDLTKDRIKLARADSANAALLSQEENRVAQAEYHPSRFLSQIPETVAILFENYQTKIKSESRTNVSPTDTADWFKGHLQ